MLRKVCTVRFSVQPCRVLHFKMSAAQLKAAAARCGTTVTVYLLAQLFLAIRAATDELQGEISIQVPVNMRKFYPSRTVRNFSMYCGIRLPVKEIEEAKSLIAPILNQLEQKASKESMSRMLTATVRLVGMLRCIPLVIKQPVAKLVYGFLGDKIFTMTFSNLGVVQLPEALAGEIDGMDFLLGAGSTNRVSCSMVTINDSACLSMTKMTVDPSFEEKLYSLLQADGIAVEAEGSELYED